MQLRNGKQTFGVSTKKNTNSKEGTLEKAKEIMQEKINQRVADKVNQYNSDDKSEVTTETKFNPSAEENQNSLKYETDEAVFIQKMRFLIKNEATYKEKQERYDYLTIIFKNIREFKEKYPLECQSRKIKKIFETYDKKKIEFITNNIPREWEWFGTLRVTRSSSEKINNIYNSLCKLQEELNR